MTLDSSLVTEPEDGPFGSERATVLVVDDDADLADTLALWLREHYDVRPAYSGESALDQVDEDVDVVLLDRRMPDLSGDRVLEGIRAAGFDCQVAMLTATDPDDDLLSMPFDEYIQKPVDRDELIETVDELVVRSGFEDETQDLFTAMSTERLLRDHDKPELLAAFRDRIESIRAEHESTVESRRRRLQRLLRINTLVRDVNRALVEATTREELARNVCDRLVEDGPYPAGFVAGYTRSTDRFAPEAATGDGIDADAVSDLIEFDPIRAPMRRAITDDSIEVVSVTDADLPDPWRDAVDDSNAIVVPLAYRETAYGTLCLFADGDVVLGGDEREVLSELGDTIGNAINAIESKRLLLTDRAIELEFELDDRDAALVSLSNATGGSFELKGLVPSDEGVIAYLHVSGASPTDLIERAESSSHVGRARCVSDRDERGLVELDLVGSSPLRTLTSAGAKIRHAAVEEGTMRLVARVASDADVRTYVDTLSREFEECSLLAQRAVDRSVDTTERFREQLDEALTDRQQTALSAAYNGGYFEWPRESSAEDVAGALDISSPTLHEHLRIAQRKLLDAYFDERDE